MSRRSTAHARKSFGSHRIVASAGFTLVEFGVVLAILGALAAITSTSYLAYLERVRVTRAVLEITNIATALSGHLASGDSLPETLADAGLGTPIDPWGNPYEYLPLIGMNLPGVGAAGGGGNSGGGTAGGNAGGGGSSGGGGNGGGGGPPAHARKDRFLVPINTDFDLYSMGKDGESVPPLTAAKSRDDVVRAANGAFVGLASKF